MVKDDEPAWLAVKDGITDTATTQSRNSGTNKYTPPFGAFVKHVYDPNYVLTGNVHMKRGVTCEAQILQELCEVSGAMDMGSQLITATWDLRAGATPDANLYVPCGPKHLMRAIQHDNRNSDVRQAVRMGEVINGEAKSTVLSTDNAPVEYVLQQQQQCATMRSMRSVLTMSSTTAERKNFTSSYWPSTHMWALSRTSRLSCHIRAEVPPRSFSRMHIREHAQHYLNSGGGKDRYERAVRADANMISKRRTHGKRPPHQVALPTWMLPPAVPDLACIPTLCYKRATSVGYDAVQRGDLDREL